MRFARFLSLSFVLVLSLAPRAAYADGTLQLQDLPPLPPLERVVEAAIRNSPALRVREALVEKNRALLDREQVQWTDNLGLDAGYRVGTYGNQVADQLQTGVTAGISLRLSLFDLLGRKRNVAAAVQELEVTREQRSEAEQELRRDVIRVYSRVELASRLVSVRSEAAEATAVHLEFAEGAFARGDLPVAELARVTEIAAKSKADAEATRSDFLEAWFELEALVGAPLGRLAAEGVR